MITVPSPKLAIAVPCFNEEEVLPRTMDSLQKTLDSLIIEGLVHEASFVVTIDDGSKDKTWNIIEQEKLKYGGRLRGIKLSRNFGHQAALLGGLFSLKSETDCIITIDADLQDDIEVMHDMLRLYSSGFEIVYGVRKSRDADTFVKRQTAYMFYRLMLFMGVNVKFNHADYRLTSRRVIAKLEDFKEVNLFLRGIFPILGFKTADVYYDRKERLAGETKYPFFKMTGFAWEGITSFSTLPLRWVFFAGFFMLLISILISLWVLIARLTGHTIRGWSTLMLSVYFIGSTQLMALGIIGEYLGKVYQETKQRPRFIIEKEI